jgi:hypothetical protein
MTTVVDAEWAEYLAKNEKARWAYDLVRAREMWASQQYFRSVKNRWGR